MKVQLHLYLEHGADGPVWWTESPDVPGFHATGSRLQEAVLRSKIALSEIFDGEHETVELECRLMGSPPASEGDRADARVSGGLHETLRTSGSAGRVLLET